MNRFYYCKLCGKLIGMIEPKDVDTICCGQAMEELKANTQDASKEKHVPAVSVQGDTLRVKVGEAAHPMEDAHAIQWVYVKTEKGGQRKALDPGEAPEVTFAFADDKPLAVFAYCNLHGLWRVDL